MSQSAIVIIVIAAAVLIAARWTWRNVQQARRGDIRCAGCPLAEQCGAKKRGHCANNAPTKASKKK